MHLINNVYFVFAGLWRYAYLFGEVPNIFYRVIRSGIQLVDAKGCAILKRLTRFATATRFGRGATLLAIDGFSQNTGAGGFTNPTRSAKQKSLCQLIGFNGIFERVGNVALANYTLKSYRRYFRAETIKLSIAPKLAIRSCFYKLFVVFPEQAMWP